MDTDGRGVDAITSDGVVVGEREYELDCLILRHRIRGRDRVHAGGPATTSSAPGSHSLSEHWQDGIRSVHGMHVHGFPNMFVLGHTQGGFTVNYPHLLEEASDHLCHILRYAVEHDVADRGGDRGGRGPSGSCNLAESARDIRAFQQQCTPGYYNNEGQPTAGGFIGSSYGKGPMAFFELLADWRDAGNFAGLELRP